MKFTFDKQISHIFYFTFCTILNSFKDDSSVRQPVVHLHDASAAAAFSRLLFGVALGDAVDGLRVARLWTITVEPGVAFVEQAGHQNGGRLVLLEEVGADEEAALLPLQRLSQATYEAVNECRLGNVGEEDAEIVDEKDRVGWQLGHLGVDRLHQLSPLESVNLTHFALIAEEARVIVTCSLVKEVHHGDGALLTATLQTADSALGGHCAVVTPALAEQHQCQTGALRSFHQRLQH